MIFLSHQKVKRRKYLTNEPEKILFRDELDWDFILGFLQANSALIAPNHFFFFFLC
jgi:hypothetical protein